MKGWKIEYASEELKWIIGADKYSRMDVERRCGFIADNNLQILITCTVVVKLWIRNSRKTSRRTFEMVFWTASTSQLAT